MIDSHCHINTERFDSDRDDVLKRARDAGVEGLIVIGAAGDLELCRSAIAMAQDHPDIWATVGVHPHNAEACSPDVLDAVREMATHPRVVAVGETGLDYYYDTSSPESQRQAFKAFIEMARGCSKPLVLHVRDAHADALEIARREGAETVGGVVHCFTGTRQEAAQWLELGFHLGITGIVTFKNAGELPRVVQETPIDRLLIETDSPYLAPVPHRGRRNEPAFVAQVAERVAELKGVSVSEVDTATANNTRRLFQL